MVADNPDCKIELKAFHSEIINDHDALKQEINSYQEIPMVRKMDNIIIQYNYMAIKKDIECVIQTEMERLLSDPALMHLVIKKN